MGHEHSLEEFRRYREKMNEKILARGNLGIKRFFNLDTQAYNDGALILGVWRVTRLAMIGPLLTAAFQFVAMLGDIIGGEPAGLPAAVFRNYLLADTAYVGLLVTQGVIMAIAIGTWALPHMHGHWPRPLRIVRN